jgi:small redox-active disulfide protein 2
MTMQIKVLGGGCENCHRLEENARTAATQMGLAAAIEHSGDRTEYARYGLLYTPGLVIDDQLVSAGRVPGVEEITIMLAKFSSSQGGQRG